MNADDLLHVGPDLRALRKARGMTLQAVADQLGRSVGWLSQIERDLSTASVDDIRDFARLYGVAPSALIGTAEAGRVVRAGQGRRIGDRAEGLSEELLSPDLTDDFEVIRSTFAPGARLAKPRTRATQEVAHIVSGRLTLWVSDERFDLGPGDSFRIQGEPYRWDNTHDKPCVAIWIIAPPVY